MRWLFYLLLAGNAALFGWGVRQLEPQAAVAPVPVLPSTVNRLLLLSELEEGSLRERRAERRPEPEPGPPASEQGTQDEAEPGVAGAAEAVPDPAPDDDTPMTLEEAVDTATRSLTVAALPVRYTESVCYSVGPLETKDEVSGMRAWLQERGGEPTLREDERREVALYWVHFPPLPDRESAIERVERMRAEGIDDIFIIPGGDQRNAVSLGVYSQAASLERRLTELRGHGYDPSVVNRYRTSVAAWYDVELPAGFRFDPSAFAARFPNAQLEPVDCGAIADAPPAAANAPAG